MQPLSCQLTVRWTVRLSVNPQQSTAHPSPNPPLPSSLSPLFPPAKQLTLILSPHSPVPAAAAACYCCCCCVLLLLLLPSLLQSLPPLARACGSLRCGRWRVKRKPLDEASGEHCKTRRKRRDPWTRNKQQGGIGQTTPKESALYQRHEEGFAINERQQKRRTQDQRRNEQSQPQQPSQARHRAPQQQLSHKPRQPVQIRSTERSHLSSAQTEWTSN